MMDISGTSGNASITAASSTSQPQLPGTSPTQRFDYFCVLHFEATCDRVSPPIPQEIIEFPVVLINASTLETEAECRSYIRPVFHPTLRKFCVDLTGIF